MKHSYMLTDKIEVLLIRESISDTLIFKRYSDNELEAISKSSIDLNRTEAHIMYCLMSNFESVTPIFDLKFYLDEVGCVLEPQSIVNAINNLRKKVQMPLMKLDCDSSAFLRNINKRGYVLTHIPRQQNEVTHNEVTHNEVTQNEVTQNEVTQNEVTHSEVTH
ncbi:helix-turn-helix domain-containing protein, partial [Vibrio metoecus]|uniref:helix-turn-helix domain-containing protein n=1 Tax=Vibrio metoecus TaxID=1481663 RepID=UPI00215D1D8C